MFTILGSTGFIGSHLVRYLKEQKIEYYAPSRNDPDIFSRPLGHVIYCVGLTADFRSKLLETVEAHVCLLRQIIASATFDSLLYLSSTRVYQRASSGKEEVVIPVNPHDPSDIYNISKLLGESLCLSCTNRQTLRVVRLSNVYGPDMGKDNFLPSVIVEALKGEITLRSPLASSKDYVFINDILPLLVEIARRGKHPLYNLACGNNISNEKIINQLTFLTGCKVVVDGSGNPYSFPLIEIEKIRNEFDFSPVQMEEYLPTLVSAIHREAQNQFISEN